MKLYCILLVAFCVSPVSANESSGDENRSETGILEEMIVTSFRKAGYTEITENTEKLLNMPGGFGDPIGAITALPGVISPVGGGEPAVRGSSPTDNRYYIDGMPAGYIFHEFNTSIFDENVVQDFQLFSSGFGAQYSEATGAVFDIRLRDPVNQDFATKLNVSMLRAGVFFESGVTENTAFYLSARHGLIHLFVAEEDEADDDGVRLITAPKDHDYQFKGKWDISDSNSFTLSFAGAGDLAEVEFTEFTNDVQENPDFEGEAKLDRNFNSEGISYRFLSDENVESTLTVARYTDSQLLNWGEGYFYELKLENYLVHGHLSEKFGAHTVSIGGEYSDKTHDYNARLIRFVCTEFDVDCLDRRGLVEEVVSVEIAETNIYVSDLWRLTDFFEIEMGIQRSGNDYNDHYEVNPKVSFELEILPGFSIVGATGKYNRTPDIEFILPFVGNPNLDSYKAKHYTLGFRGEIGYSWTWLLEGYYKELSNLPLSLNEDQPSADLYYSNGISGEVRGLDIMLNKNLVDKWFGWASLSVAKSERTNLETQETRDYTLDTPIVLNLVANYQLSQKWSAGFRFTLKSGEATTEIIGLRQNEDFPDKFLPLFGEAYADRLPYYSRLDFRVEREFSFRGGESSFYIDILNLLNRDNIADRNLDYDRVNETGELYLEDTQDMGIFPSIGVILKF